MEKRMFSTIGDNISLIGFGTMRFPLLDQETKQVDMDKTQKMIDYAIESGVNYFDTAYMYHEEKSEEIVRETLVKKYPRDKFYLADKLPLWKCAEYADYQKVFDIQLERTGVEYFDYYLLHAMNLQRFEEHEKMGVFNFLKELKEKGKVRHIGFSFHDKADVFKKILSAHPEIEFVQLQINYLDWKALGSDICYNFAKEMGKPVIVMEPVKGGILSSLNEKSTSILKNKDSKASIASWAIRYAASFDNIMTVLSGMSSMGQVVDNINTMNSFRAFDSEDYKLIDQVIEEINKLPTVPCTSCKYCIECPKEIPIFNIFDIYNNYLKSNNLEMMQKLYNNIAEEKRADKCIRCGYCESQCPQSIEIINRLEEISKVF